MPQYDMTQAEAEKLRIWDQLSCCACDGVAKQPRQSQTLFQTSK